MRPSFKALVLFLIAFATVACTRVEGTGRRQFLLTSAEQENSLGSQAYQEVLGSEKTSTDAAARAMVERVGKRIAAVAPDRGFTYEFNLIESKSANAFCLPGGKVAIYTGILPFCENEAGLAAVMGHEIGHAIARHGGERMSQQTVASGLQSALAIALQAKGVKPTETNLALGAFGAGAKIGVLLPFSREHESEADYLGLTYMAKAGYDPDEAVKFWGRFATLGGKGPEFLSTHPASERRAADLADRRKEAGKLYKKAPQKYGIGEMVPVKYRRQSGK
jgi:predicted Zn-dependent protease